jgi:Uncharacterized conserved protein (DUF2163)
VAFNLLELARGKGRKVNLYLFRYGVQSGNIFAYTSHTQSIVKGGVTYLPVPISRGSIVVKGTMDKSSLEVRTSVALPIAELFRVYPPTQVISLTIFEGHLNDPDAEYKTCWSGRVTSAKRDVNELLMSCEPSRTMLRRYGLRRFYQYSCPHILYGSQCGASKTATKLHRTDYSISGLTIALPNADSFSSVADNYLGGLVEWDNAIGEREIRTIIAITKRVAGVGTNTVTVSGNLRGLTTATPVDLFAGCSHDLAGCGFHSNVDNFGGCPYIPKKNPVGSTTLYY